MEFPRRLLMPEAGCPGTPLGGNLGWDPKVGETNFTDRPVDHPRMAVGAALEALVIVLQKHLKLP
jgi:hypothetical protein